ncbi:MAG: hypothetical protein BGO30_09585 [Bacteroidetes bacterium 41-46]|nr:MAG: hypothetical protein BGO30_09585 [Bacteroidetes bacterium 41-46]
MPKVRKKFLRKNFYAVISGNRLIMNKMFDSLKKANIYNYLLYKILPEMTALEFSLPLFKILMR